MPFFVQTTLGLLPFVAVWVVGIVLALVTWKRHPQASALATAGFAIFLLEAVAGVVLLAVLMRPQDVSFEARMRLLTLTGYARGAVRLVGWGLILAALFLRRPQPGPRDEEDYPEEGLPETGIRQGHGQ
jgi:hypothetical protein